MTTTSNPPAAECVGESTQNLTYLLHAPVFRRPFATGEFPAIRPAGVDELARLSANETLTLEVGVPPLDALPYESRHAVPVVYSKADERPARYRGRRRRGVQGWTMLVIGAGAILLAEAAIALILIAVFT